MLMPVFDSDSISVCDDCGMIFDESLSDFKVLSGAASG
jgi:hypothetical protein